MRSPSTPLPPKENATFGPEGSPAISCADWPAPLKEGVSTAAQAMSADPMKCLIIASFREPGREGAKPTHLAFARNKGSVDAINDGAVDDEPDRLRLAPRDAL